MKAKRLKGHVAVVAGATRGAGRGIARGGQDTYFLSNSSTAA